MAEEEVEQPKISFDLVNDQSGDPENQSHSPLSQHQQDEKGMKRNTNLGKLIKRITMKNARHRASTDDGDFEFPMISEIHTKKSQEPTKKFDLSDESRLDLPVHLNMAENMKSIQNKYNAFWNNSENAFEDVRN